MRWESGDQPALRSALKHGSGFMTDAVDDGAPCPFCGASSLIRSIGDEETDDARVHAYCTNSQCSAREVIIIADDHSGPYRADIALLSRLDAGQVAEEPVSSAFKHWWNGGDLLDADSSLAVRRRLGEDVPCECTGCTKGPLLAQGA